MTAYDDALRALAASEGIEYVDCRVQPGWESERPRLRVVVPVPTVKHEPVPVPVDAPILLRSTFEQLQLDPRHREAAARGRAVHEAALARAEAEGISYEDAIAKERP